MHCSIEVDALSDLLLDLYEHARALPLGAFQHQALERVQRVLPFDKAWWGISNADRELHSSYAFHLPGTYAAAWERIKAQDRLAELAQARIGHTVSIDFADPAVAADYRAFGAEFGIRHALTTVIVNAELNLHIFLSIYRGVGQPPFNPGEQLLKELLMPHLWATWTANWLGQLEHLRAYASTSRTALAIADDRGILLAAEPRFLELARVEWPGWQGPALPAAAHPRLNASTSQAGGRINLKSTAVHGLHLIEFRLRSRLDGLTPRERSVAEAFGVGRSYREIAATLGLSPTTVRHHLRGVYTKLGISDKAELAQLVNAHADGAGVRARLEHNLA